ncbi:MAG: aminodeoxychorismate/anthranilate synthase component II [Candidatus Zixiibacteriota bacterium]
MILFIDNYDSFVYNLVQYVGAVTPDLQIARNDQITIGEIENLKPDKIVISPGPGHPSEAGISNDVIKRFYKEIPILGICLGHQAIGHSFGAKVDLAERLLHGKTSPIYHRETGILRGLPNPFLATRYHSLAVIEETLPKELESMAYTSDGEIMGLRHVEYPLFGLQFHPESILTTDGKQIIANFLNWV